MDEPMKIIALEAENVKRLKAIRIEPDGTMQVIGGNNAQGKSSVLDAIWLALGGREASKANPKPVRDGEKKAFVSLDLGTMTVTRTWSNGNTQLEVRSKDGAKYGQAQTTLSALVGPVGFDPLEFTRQSPKDQRDTLLSLVDVGIDLDDLAAKRAELYDERTEIGRQVKAIGDVPDVPKDAPTEEVFAANLLNKIADAETENRSRQFDLDEMGRLEADIKRLKSNLAEAERRLDGLLEAAKSGELEPIDTDAMRAELDGIEESNRQARENATNIRRATKRDELQAQYDMHTEEIEHLDKQRADALAAAKFPIEGLGFDDDGVTYQGVPLAQASSAEQIRVSLAIGMALNPRLRVLMIRDGSLLDADSMAAIREQVAGKSFQLFVERVGGDDDGAIIISDGEVAA